jgi:hydrogenase nickel incorporation protein HypB
MKAPVIEKQFHDPNPVALLNRDALREAGVLAVSVLGGPGCGKTSLIEATIEQLSPDLHAGVIACDISSHRDADRISCDTKQVVQVNTGDGGVLDATHIRDALRWLDLKSIDLLFIENVGTLALPQVPRLGQDATAVVFSVAAGDDKADKHPDLVRAANVVILNKTDLLSSVPFNLEAFREDVRRINPNVPLIEVSALTEAGMEQWAQWLRTRATNENQPDRLWFG